MRLTNSFSVKIIITLMFALSLETCVQPTRSTLRHEYAMSMRETGLLSESTGPKPNIEAFEEFEEFEKLLQDIDLEDKENSHNLGLMLKFDLIVTI